jgi:lipopolysaccharide/colanic/teichoic acid biosynthesis glycosyltransferase
MKRIFDILFSILLIIVLSPFLIIISIILLLSNEHEILYLQDRVGYLNCNFKIIKFATMLKNSPNIGTGSITLKNDPRVFKIGKFLRKSKLNELPQLFNVLKGDMSLVGPRPQMKVDLDKFPVEMKDIIYRAKPGITSLASIFYRDEESIISKFPGDKHEFYKKEIAPYKATLDIWYYENLSMILDLKILVTTFWVIFFPNSNILDYLFPNLPKKGF